MIIIGNNRSTIFRTSIFTAFTNLRYLYGWRGCTIGLIPQVVAYIVVARPHIVFLLFFSERTGHQDGQVPKTVAAAPAEAVPEISEERMTIGKSVCMLEAPPITTSLTAGVLTTEGEESYDNAQVEAVRHYFQPVSPKISVVPVELKLRELTISTRANPKGSRFLTPYSGGTPSV